MNIRYRKKEEKINNLKDIFEQNSKEKFNELEKYLIEKNHNLKKKQDDFTNLKNNSEKIEIRIKLLVGKNNNFLELEKKLKEIKNNSIVITFLEEAKKLYDSIKNNKRYLIIFLYLK